MATMKISYEFLPLVILIFSSVNLSCSGSGSAQNIQTYYPHSNPPPAAATIESAPPRGSPAPARTSKRKIVTAVAATAASTFVVAGVFFLLCSWCFLARRRKHSNPDGGATPASRDRSEFTRVGGNLKGLIVDEDGLEMVYWRKVMRSNGGLYKEPFERPVITGNQENVTVPRGKSSSSQSQTHPGQRLDDQGDSGEGRPSTELSAPPPEKKILPIPPPPPIPARKKPPMPPPPKPPNGGKMSPAAVKEDQVMLKPLHWEKVNVNPDQSMVWDKIEKGSFQYNGDMMEALFGVVAANRRSPKEESAAMITGEASNPNVRIFILDPRKSQNTAIVIKSLGVPRGELIDSLLEGKGLSIEALEKLARIVPTGEEEAKILSFTGDAAKLADAESFLFNLLKAVPSAFTRAKAMLFRSNYDSEILNVKESLQCLESACNELRSRRIFLKLLEAILKAGNRLNAGTARGDAKAFNLTTLLKLSDYKSSDAKTTLLHFVIHEVVRNEGRRCVLQAGPTPPSSHSDTDFLRLGLPVVSGLGSDLANVKKAANVEYDVLESTLACLTTQVGETQKLVAKCRGGSMYNPTPEVYRKDPPLAKCASFGGGRFLAEMREFLECAEAEIKTVQDEHTRVMELVKTTTEYYQSSSSGDKNSVQLFAIVKDFLGLVDQTCVEIARGLQQKQSVVGSGSGSSPSSDVLRTRVTFPRLPDHFLSDKSSSNDESEDDSSGTILPTKV